MYWKLRSKRITTSLLALSLVIGQPATIVMADESEETVEETESQLTEANLAGLEGTELAKTIVRLAWQEKLERKDLKNLFETWGFETKEVTLQNPEDEEIESLSIQENEIWKTVNNWDEEKPELVTAEELETDGWKILDDAENEEVLPETTTEAKQDEEKQEPEAVPEEELITTEQSKEEKTEKAETKEETTDSEESSEEQKSTEQPKQDSEEKPVTLDEAEEESPNEQPETMAEEVESEFPILTLKGNQLVIEGKNSEIWGIKEVSEDDRGFKIQLAFKGIPNQAGYFMIELDDSLNIQNTCVYRIIDLEKGSDELGRVVITQSQIYISFEDRISEDLYEEDLIIPLYINFKNVTNLEDLSWNSDMSIRSKDKLSLFDARIADDIVESTSQRPSASILSGCKGERWYGNVDKISPQTAEGAIQWVNKYIGIKFKFDPNVSNPKIDGQCVQLINAYYTALGQPRPIISYAAQLANAAPPKGSGWQRLAGVQPKKGDILIYTGGLLYYDDYGNPYRPGHVAIYESDKVTYHSNYNYHTFVEKITGVNYKDMPLVTYWGVMRPKFNNDPNYYVKYDKNASDATGTMKQTTHKYETDTYLPKCTFKRTGYTFTGWFIKNSAGEWRCYKNNKWQYLKSSEAKTSTADYRFLYKDKNRINQLIGNGEICTAVAQWSPNPYKVIYKANGGLGNQMSSTTHKCGKTTYLSKCTYTRPGYTFKGWYAYNSSGKVKCKDNNWRSESAAGSNKKLYTDGSEVKQVIGPGKTATLKAQWTANKYTVKYNSNGGSGNQMSATTHTYNTSSKLRKNTYTRKGYTFGGWYVKNSSGKWRAKNSKTNGYEWATASQISSNNNLTKKVYDDQSDVKTLTTSGTVTCYAIWKPIRVTMYRLYNPNSGEHFYTSNTSEKNNLVKVGWKYEGPGWIAPKVSNTPVYRLYNANAGDHHYTMNKAERDNLVKAGWKNEGIGWYSDDSKGVALYRQYNKNAKAGSHNYTTNKSENNMLVKAGWKAEGIGWYGLK